MTPLCSQSQSQPFLPYSTGQKIIPCLLPQEPLLGAERQLPLLPASSFLQSFSEALARAARLLPRENCHKVRGGSAEGNEQPLYWHVLEQE